MASKSKRKDKTLTSNSAMHKLIQKIVTLNRKEFYFARILQPEDWIFKL